MENNLDRFWVSFKQWYLYELPQNNLIKEQFISYDEHDDAKPYLDIDFNHYYKLNFGVEYDGILEKDETITVKSLKMLTELTYSEFIKDRYAFTVDVNKRLVKFNIPLKLRNGVLISVGHKSSNEIKYIYNYEQLERKIKYSEELIISDELLDKKTALDYINEIFDEFIELHGDRCYGDDKAMVCGLGRIENQNYTIIAEQKGRNTKENIERNFGMPNPESYRKAIRMMKQAEKFNRPVITFIDTKGAYPGVEAEQRGQGEAIAKSMFEMAKLTVPVIAIVIGEGSSGGALAIGVANKVIMLENAIYSILSPEGYSSILWKDSSRFKEAADRMKLTANDLYDMGIIETVIKESIENYTTEKELFKNITGKIKQEIQTTVQKLKTKTKDEIVEERYQKFRKISGFKEV